MKYIESKVDKIVAMRFSRSHMSNAKWRKAFRVLVSADLALVHCYWKFVDDNKVFYNGFPFEADLLETGLDDAAISCSGPLEYKEIEWIEIPRQYVVEERKDIGFRRVVNQDVDKVAEALGKVGQFPIEMTETGLRLYGYS